MYSSGFNDGRQVNLDIEQARKYVLKLSTHVKDPAKLNSRIYVGNLSRVNVNREHVFLEFCKYGDIEAISKMMPANNSSNKLYTFVQFNREDDARAAADSMDRAHFQGTTIGKLNI